MVAAAVKRVRVSEHFFRDELECKCGCGIMNATPQLLALLEAMRRHLNRPMSLTSACRCVDHNTRSGGSKNSRHITGEAADIPAPDDGTRFELVQAAIACGAGGIGIAKTFVHVDCRPRTVARCWLY